jgi:hypothetical protein
MRLINKIIILLFIIIFLTSCTGTSEKTLQYNFKQGYGNLALTTLENNPPKIVYPNSDFRIVIKLKNQGAYDVTKGLVKIIGFDEKYISLEDNEKEIFSPEEDILRGMSQFNPVGDHTFLTFEAKSKKLFPGAESYDAYYFIKAEYNYKTELSQTVCINPKLYEVYTSGCKVEPKISLSGQGSPLAITNMEEIIHPGNIPQIEFRFTLKNRGRGLVKQVYLSQAKLAGKFLDCEFKNNPGLDTKTFNFDENQEATLICKKTLEDQRSYDTIIYLEIPFTYSIQEKKKITLKE